MRKYKVIVKQGKQIIHEDEVLASTEKQVSIDTRRKFPFGTIKITRMQKKPGIQMTIDDVINDC